MGFIKAIGRIFSMIVSTLKRVWNAIRKRFGVLLLIFAVCCFVFPAFLPALLSMVGAPAWLTTAAGAVATKVASYGLMASVGTAIGTVALLSPGTITEAAHNIGQAASGVVDEAGNVVKDVVHAGGSIINEGAGAFLQPNVLLIGGIALGAYLLTRSKE